MPSGHVIHVSLTVWLKSTTGSPAFYCVCEVNVEKSDAGAGGVSEVEARASRAEGMGVALVLGGVVTRRSCGCGGF